MKAIFISTQHCVDLERTVHSHGWLNLSPFLWVDERRELTRLERVGQQVLLVTIRQKNTDGLIVQVPAEPNEQDQAQLIARIRRWFMVDWDPMDAISTARRLDRSVATFIETGGGRFLRGSTFYEDLYKTICTINTSWANTVRMARAVATLSGIGCAATPTDVQERSVEDLRATCGLGYRASVLHRLTTNLLHQGVIDGAGNLLVADFPRQALLDLKGIGPYAADHLRVLQQDFARIPVDSEVRSYCARLFRCENTDVNEFFEPWGNFRFLGYKVGRILRRQNWIGN